MQKKTKQTYPQGRRWCFTMFKYTEALLDKIKAKVGEEIRAAVWQEEKSPTTGKRHIQGYVIFDKQIRTQSVKVALGDESAHIELAQGNTCSNYAYCTKPESATGRFQYKGGDFATHQGSRTDLKLIIQLIQEGKSMEDIAKFDPANLIKYHKGIQYTQQTIKQSLVPNTFPRVTIVLWGKTGSGKSLWAREYAKNHKLTLYNKSPGRDCSPQWFDGYDGEDILLLDDFDPNQVPYRELLVWLDIYKHRVQQKGTMTLGLWNTVIITSNLDPAYWYMTGDKSLTAEQRQPLTRRLDYIYLAPDEGYLTTKYPPTIKLIGRNPPEEEKEGKEEEREELEEGEIQEEKEERKQQDPWLDQWNLPAINLQRALVCPSPLQLSPIELPDEDLSHFNLRSMAWNGATGEYDCVDNIPNIKYAKY